MSNALFQTNPFHPRPITSAKGYHLWDDCGKHYVDLLSGTWCNVLADDATLVEAIKEHLDKPVHMGAPFVSLAIEQAMEALSRHLPQSLNRFIFLNTGSEAVELALKLARAATGWHKMAVFEKGYYGATSYALSLSEVGQAMSYLPHTDQMLRVPAPYCHRCKQKQHCKAPAFDCLKPLIEALNQESNDIAGILYEPIIAGGMIVPPVGYGSALQKIANQKGVVLIAEEVTTGVCRTGEWFGFQLDDVSPDVLVIGKIVGGGLPIAVVVTTEAIEKQCHGIVKHVQSHQNDPFSAYVVSSVILRMEEMDAPILASSVGERFRLALEKRMTENESMTEWVVDLRIKGAMIGIELGGSLENRVIEVADALMQEGYIVNPYPLNNTLRLFPAFVLNEKIIDDFVVAFERCMMKLTTQ